MTCAARAGVPFFFALSGFFCFGADSRQAARRIRSLCRLNLWGVALVLLWGCAATELGAAPFARFQGSSALYLRSQVPDGWAVMFWLLADVNPFSGFLWFLMALLKCTCLLWVYLRFYGEEKPDYRWLYLGGAMLFAQYLIQGPLSAGTGSQTSVFILRGTLLLGLPMFILGIFLGQHWQRVWENFHLTGAKAAGLILLGIWLGWQELQYLGQADAHLGSILAAVCALLLCARYPCSGSRIAPLAVQCGRWSTGIYLCQNIAIGMMECWITPAFGGQVKGWIWLRPVLVILLSLAMAAGNSWVWEGLKKRVRPRTGNREV